MRSFRQGLFQHLTALCIMIAYSAEIRKKIMCSHDFGFLQQNSMRFPYLASVVSKVSLLYNEENNSFFNGYPSLKQKLG